MRVEMTFRRLFTADGIANYFWKARPIPRPVGTATDGGH
jgi:hydroxymethylglutaryl-CoA synthase